MDCCGYANLVDFTQSRFIPVYRRQNLYAETAVFVSSPARRLQTRNFFLSAYHSTGLEISGSAISEECLRAHRSIYQRHSRSCSSYTTPSVRPSKRKSTGTRTAAVDTLDPSFTSSSCRSQCPPTRTTGSHMSVCSHVEMSRSRSIPHVISSHFPPDRPSQFSSPLPHSSTPFLVSSR